jgi:hypothetical protein
LDHTGDRDLVCCGHDHRPGITQVANLKGGKTWLENSDAIGGPGAKSTCVLGSLATMNFDLARAETS